MKIGYDLKIEQTQKLTMTPELIQAIQILQFNSHELEEFVQEELLQNPMLEYGQEAPKPERKDSLTEKTEEPDFDLREKIREAEYDDISYKQWEYVKDREETSFEQFVTKDETLEDYLSSQLIFADISEEEKKLGRYIIEALDENGYMTLELSKVAKACNTCEELAGRALELIQTFEPAGVGARNLEECLLIQLDAKGLLDDQIEYIVRNHLQDLGENRLGKVAKAAGMSLTEVQEVVDLIRTLEPKPGRQFSTGESVKYIIPDVIVEKVEDDYQVLTNEGTVPRLMVSPYYMSLAKKTTEDEELAKYLNSKYNSALWLIRSIAQRKQTIYSVAETVVKHQKAFLDLGSKHLKPLTLREVAEDLGIHESTVSRSINGKYMQTPRGVFELKYFFSGGITGSDGEGLSSNSIKSFIKEIIDGEDPKRPYSDQDMVEILGEKGINLSRRTVAKYREDMNILSSPKRRRY